MIAVIEIYHGFLNAVERKTSTTIALPPAPVVVVEEVIEEPKVEPKPIVPRVKHINKNLVLDMLLKQLDSIHRLDIEEVRVFKRPTPPVFAVLKALPMIFKPELDSVQNNDYEFWMKHIRLLLENGPGFYNDLRNFKWEYMERQTYDSLAAYINENEQYFCYSIAVKNCCAIPGICKWIITIKNIYEVTHDIWPTDPNWPNKKWPLLEVFDDLQVEVKEIEVVEKVVRKSSIPLHSAWEWELANMQRQANN